MFFFALYDNLLILSFFLYNKNKKKVGNLGVSSLSDLFISAIFYFLADLFSPQFVYMIKLAITYCF